MAQVKAIDRKAEILIEIQGELIRKVNVNVQASDLFREGRCQEAVELLASLDNSVIEMLSAEYEVLEEMEGEPFDKAQKREKIVEGFLSQKEWGSEIENREESSKDLIARINAVIDDEYNSVKSECTTYGKLKDSLMKVEKETAWKEPKLASYVEKRFRIDLNEDIHQKAISAVIDKDNAFPEKHFAKPETEQSAEIRGITIDLSTHGIQQEAEENK